MTCRTRSLAAAFVVSCCLGLLAGGVMAAEADPFKEAATYEAGQSRKALVAINKTVRASTADPAKRKEVERKLIALLKSKDVTLHAKWFVCRQLALVGSAEAVPTLAVHLTEDDKQLGYMARFALEQIPNAAALAALRDALGKTQGKTRIGLINSLAVRRDKAAIPRLVKMLGKDRATAAAAAAALGKIGGKEAVEALNKARNFARLGVGDDIEDALLTCARRLLAAGKTDEAKAIFAGLEASGTSKQVKLGAFAGLVKAGGAQALPRLLRALESKDLQLRNTALRLAEQIPGREATRAIADRVGSAPADVAVALLDVLATRSDKAAAPTVAKAAQSKDVSVRLAALTALGSLGDASSVKPLLTVATGNKGKESAAARNGLIRLKGDGVDAALLGAMKGAAAPVRIEITRILAARSSAAAVPMLLAAAREDPDATLRAESLRALQSLASPKALGGLVALLVGARSDGERAAAEKTVLAVIARLEDRQKAAPPLLAALADAKTGVPARCSLLRVAGRIGGPKALAAVRDGAKSTDAAVKNTAVRTLANWPTPEPMADLLAIARATDNKTHKVLALRGFLRMTTLPHKRSAAESRKLYAEAMTLATEPQERKTILAELAKLKDPTALTMALALLSDKAVANEAAAAAVAISKMLLSSHNKEAVAALKKVANVFKGKDAGRLADDALAMAKLGANIAPEGKATSPDGLDKDGASGGDQAAIDGNPTTYWDEVDGKKLYRLVVTFAKPRRVSAISILAYGHHNYSPRDFDVLADGKVVRSLKNAAYTKSFLVVTFPATAAKAIELKITGYYGQSPAIRELGIYEPPK